MKQLLDMNFAKLREKIGFDRWVLVMVLPPKGVQDSHGMSCFSLESKEFLSTLWCGWKQPLSWSCVIIEHIELIEWEHFNVPADVWNVLICDRSLVGKLSSDNFSSFSAGPLNHWVPKLPNSFQIYAMLQLVKGWSVQKSGAFATAQNEWSALSFRNRAKSIANGERDGSYCGCCCQSPVVVPEFLGNSPVIRATGIGFAGLAGRFSRCTHKSWVSSRQPEPKGWPRWMGGIWFPRYRVVEPRVCWNIDIWKRWEVT